MHKNRKHKNPLLTKTGKTRLGNLGYAKLVEMLSKCKPKERSKIQNRINNFVKKTGFKVPETVDTPVEEAV